MPIGKEEFLYCSSRSSVMGEAVSLNISYFEIYVYEEGSINEAT